MPALVKDSKTQQPRLQMKSLKFRSVRGVADWLDSFASIRRNASSCKVLDDSTISDLIKPSKLTKVNTPMMAQLRELFGRRDSQQVNSRTLNAIVEQFVSNQDLGVFSEDVYLYLLQHHVNSAEKIISIIESIKLHLKSNIDQFNVIEALVLQILVSLKRNELHLTKPLVDSFEDLLADVNDRFHIQNCETQFQPIVSQEILEFYVKVRKLADSKRIFTDLIAKNLCPAERVTVSYLAALSDEVSNDRLKEFALISDFRPIIERAQNPKTFFYLIPLCRHLDEVTSLLTIIKKSKNVKEILDVNIVSFISKIAGIKNDPLITSACLCSLYRMASPFYSQNLPEKFTKAFVLAFARLANYTMAASIMERDTVSLSADFLKAILSNLERGKNNKLNELDAILEKEFIERCMIPAYHRLPLTSKLEFISQVHSPAMLSAMLTSETSPAKNMQFDLLRKLLKHSLENNISLQVPEESWEIIISKAELNSVLKNHNVTAETLRKRA